MSRINLLPRQRERSAVYRKNLRVARVSSAVAIGIVLVCALVVFFLHLQLGLGALRKQEEDLVATLNAAKAKIAKLVIVHQRLKDVDEILKERATAETVLQEIAGKVPGGVSLGSISLSQGSVNVTVSSSSLSAIEDFLTIMVAMAEEKKFFSKVMLNGATLGSTDNQYTFSVKGNLL